MTVRGHSSTFHSFLQDTRKPNSFLDSVKAIRTELEEFASTRITSMPSSIVSYENLEAIYINSYKAYKGIDKQMKSFNKTAKEKTKLRKMIHKSENARKMYQAKKYFFVAIDIESYEKDHSCILEVGWSMYNSKTDLYMDRHFCVNENKHLRNGQYVPDMKNRFNFGKTIWEDQKTIADEFVKDLTSDDVKGYVVIVGHGVNMDINYLETMGVKINDLIEDDFQFDTAEMNAARIGKPNERISLGRLLDLLDIENYSLHNAGNDAHYSLLLFFELCKLPIMPPASEELEYISDSD
ncbi:2833_t:CDS:2 [Diversispora eburnea]|uniref:2833_t:CDS:1 n=1 Tax=Diversispora eburnea TaxID=1213867 RepID=A0A9N9G3Y4_9GLOM|nr:2833_t:CDS:2 [Diversispora eburnea]